MVQTIQTHLKYTNHANKPWSHHPPKSRSCSEELLSLVFSFPLKLFLMGWFWSGSQSDPVKKLDPSLREYLEQETPDKYVPAPELKQPAPAPTPLPESKESASPSEPKVPAASLFQDGRYADLWKTYKAPVIADESSGVRGAERVIEKFKERGNTVQRAAMENCALEHEDLTYCFQRGNWRKQIESRLTLCAAENRTFSRCFLTQTVSSLPEQHSLLFIAEHCVDIGAEIPSGPWLRRVL